jgi:hypothetical protein
MNLNNYQNIYNLWLWNTFTQYNRIDLEKEIGPDTTLFNIQKSYSEYFFNLLRPKIDPNGIFKNFSFQKLLGRSGVVKINLKEYGEVVFTLSKWLDSLDTLSLASDYYFWWSDMITEAKLDKGLSLGKILEVSWERLFGSPLDLLLCVGRRSLDRAKDQYAFALTTIITKFPAIVARSFWSLSDDYQKPSIIATDSNSELIAQLVQMRDKKGVIWIAEIVQSGKSLEATDNYPIVDDVLYAPLAKECNAISGMYSFTKPLCKIDPTSQVWIIAKNIQMPINAELCRVGDQKRDSRDDFIFYLIEILKQSKPTDYKYES